MLSFPWKSAPEPARIRRVSDHIQWACMPLPFVLDHVNVWFLRGNTGSIIVDTGLQTSQTRQIWQALLEQLDAAPGGLLVTHYHPDHAGLAGWLAQQFAMPVWFSQQDLDFARGAHAISDAEFAQAQDDWYLLHGLDSQRRATMRQAGNTYRPLVHALPGEVQLLGNDDELHTGIANWRVLTFGGHAPEMICLYSEALNVLIAADQLLPSITPNVSLNHYTRDPDPLASFLASLDQLSQLPPDVLVLPSHGLPFTGLHERIAQLRAHHAERFELLVDACRAPSTAADMLPVLFQRSLDFQQLMFAMGESIAHLRYLVNTSQIKAVVHEDRMRFHT